MKFISSFLLFCCLALCSRAQSIEDKINKAAENILPKIQTWRRHIHQHPELGNREFQTMAYIANHLRSLGIDVKTGVAKTGVVGILKGGKPGPVIALRADMDALPIEERTNIPFKSTSKAEYLGDTVSVMHACGHDTHVAILMGTAEVLATHRKEIPGTVKFIFQPAEEGAPGDEEGGAALMVKEGVMDNPKVDAIFGLHISSGLDIGKIEYKSGAFMASVDWFYITVKGKGAHGASPWNGIDPIMVSAQIINGLQTIVSRSEDLTTSPVVITVGKIEGGVRENIIPESVSFSGTIRTLDENIHLDVHEKIKRTAENIAKAYGAEAIVTIKKVTNVTYNDPALLQQSLPALRKAAGSHNVTERVWSTGGEDFAFYGDHAPALFFNLGGKPLDEDHQPKAGGHHTPDFYVDDSKLDVGVKAFCQLILSN
ncbi:MAG: amidohydrolase [Bacteroidetes bacterium]|nr:amidohydrolase [Bacteroidota bacterium]